MKNVYTDKYTKANIDELVGYLKKNSQGYYSGGEHISNTEYDILTEHLRSMDPQNTFLTVIEFEDDVVVDGKKRPTVKHTTPMLSIDKAYSPTDLERFIRRVEKDAKEIGLKLKDLTFRMTPKLDGMAAKYENDILVSRGDGSKGSDISHILKRGIIIKGGKNSGVGEIVMKNSSFDQYFADRIDHPRNMVAGVVNADTLTDEAKLAIKKKSIHFVPFSSLEFWEGGADQLLADIDTIRDKLIKKIDYPLDGVVIEVTDERVKEKMGATNHHNRWQVALKTLGETATTEILNIRWQTGRTGKITPVLEIKPVRLSGASLSNVTAHHAGMVKELCLGKGAKIEVIRSGEVIPKLLHVITACDKGDVISECPSCKGDVEWQNDFLMCVNASCSARHVTSLFYWFKTLRTADGFGPKTIEVLVDNGKTRLEEVYALQESDFVKMGFGEKQSENLEKSLQTSLRTEIEDAKFLAAFGIVHLGEGESRKLLCHYKLEELKDLTEENISDIKGFGKKTSSAIVEGVERLWPTIEHMLSLGFVLQRTLTVKEQEELVKSLNHKLVGKKVLFTGTMTTGTRDAIKKHARNIGINVASGYSKSLDYLVIGSDVGVGNNKFDDATTDSVPIIGEQEYLNMIK